MSISQNIDGLLALSGDFSPMDKVYDSLREIPFPGNSSFTSLHQALESGHYTVSAPPSDLKPPLGKTGVQNPLVTDAVLGIDWLELFGNWQLSVLNEYIDPQTLDFSGAKYHFTYQYLGSGGRFYKYRFQVFESGEPFAVFRCCPHKGVKFEQNCVHLKIENRLLYGSWASLCSRIAAFFVSNGGAPLSITRLDVFLDGGSGVLDMANTILHDSIFKKHFPKHELSYFRRGRAGMQIHDMSEEGSFTSFSIGSRSSDRSFRAYNKTLELSLSEGKKEYISDFHQANDFPEGKDVYRYEFTFRSKFLRSKGVLAAPLERGFGLNDIFNPKSLWSLFYSAQHGYLVFCNNDHEKRSECSSIPLFAYPKECKYLPSLRRVRSISPRQVKSTIKYIIQSVMSSPSLDTENVVRDRVEFHRELDKVYLISHMIEKHNLRNWLEDKAPLIKKDLEDRFIFSGFTFHTQVLGFDWILQRIFDTTLIGGKYQKYTDEVGLYKLEMSLNGTSFTPVPLDDVDVPF